MGVLVLLWVLGYWVSWFLWFLFLVLGYGCPGSSGSYFMGVLVLSFMGVLVLSSYLFPVVHISSVLLCYLPPPNLNEVLP